MNTYLVIKEPYNRYNPQPLEVKIVKAESLETVCREILHIECLGYIDSAEKTLKLVNGDGMSSYDIRLISDHLVGEVSDNLL